MPNTGRSSGSVATPVPSARDVVPQQVTRSFELAGTRFSPTAPCPPRQESSQGSVSSRPKRRPASRSKVSSARSSSSSSATVELVRPSSVVPFSHGQARARFCGSPSVFSTTISDDVPPSSLSARVNAALGMSIRQATDTPREQAPSLFPDENRAIDSEVASVAARSGVSARFSQHSSRKDGSVNGWRSSCSAGSAQKPQLNAGISEKTEATDINSNQPVSAPTAPWSVERANRDQPNWERAHEIKQDYRLILDEQISQNAQEAKRRIEEDLDLDNKTQVSLATRSHKWGVDAQNIGRERAIFKELMATVAERERRAHELKNAEKLENQRWATETNQRLSQQWFARKQRDRKEWATLASAWDDAAQAKQKQRAEERDASLRSEREHNSRVVRGMGEPRRMRKPACPHAAVQS